MARRIDRWLTFCRYCGQRQMWAEPPASHPCPAEGPDGVRTFETCVPIRFVVGIGDCRQEEPPCIIVEFKVGAGYCSRRCRGSLSPICYCQTCAGEQHGVDNIMAPLDSGREIMDFINSRTPRGEIRRRGRRTT